MCACISLYLSQCDEASDQLLRHNMIQLSRLAEFGELKQSLQCKDNKTWVSDGETEQTNVEKSSTNQIFHFAPKDFFQ